MPPGMRAMGKFLIHDKIDLQPSFVQALLQACFELNIQSILVEGGNILAELFVNEGLWDEARVIESTETVIANGGAPLLSNQELIFSEKCQPMFFPSTKTK